MFGFFTPHNLRGPWRLYEKCSTEKFNWNIKSCTARGAHCDSVPHQQSHSGLGGLWRPPTSPLIERHTVDSWPGLVVGYIFYCTGNYLIIFWQLEAGESEMWLHSTVILLLITDNTLRVVNIYIYPPANNILSHQPVQFQCSVEVSRLVRLTWKHPFEDGRVGLDCVVNTCDQLWQYYHHKTVFADCLGTVTCQQTSDQSRLWPQPWIIVPVEWYLWWIQDVRFYMDIIVKISWYLRSWNMSRYSNVRSLYDLLSNVATSIFKEELNDLHELWYERI